MDPKKKFIIHSRKEIISDCLMALGWSDSVSNSFFYEVKSSLSFLFDLQEEMMPKGSFSKEALSGKFSDVFIPASIYLVLTQQPQNIRIWRSQTVHSFLSVQGD